MSILAAAFLITLTPADPQPDLCTLVERLNVVVLRDTGYPPPPCPQIGFAALARSTTERSQAAAFNPATGAVELAADLDLTAPFGQSYLLHELVHAAQYANGAQTRASCPAALEAQAYTVQADFLRAHDLGREAVLVQMLAWHLGSCGSPD